MLLDSARENYQLMKPMWKTIIIADYIPFTVDLVTIDAVAVTVISMVVELEDAVEYI